MNPRTFTLSLLFLAAGPGETRAGEVSWEDAFHQSYGSHLAQRLDVIVPEDRGTEALPILVFFHGGAWSHGDKLLYRGFAKAVAREGFVVVTPNYRKFPFARYPEFMHDAAESVSWIAKHADRFGGDPSRILLGGHSAGGHMAVLLALEPRFLSSVGVPSTSIRGVVGLAPPLALDEKRWQLLEPIFGQDCAPEIVRPALLSDGDHPPIFLTAGGLDPVVPDESVERAYARLDEAGGPVEFTRYPLRGHITVQPLLPGEDGNGKPFRDLVAFLREADSASMEKANAADSHVRLKFARGGSLSSRSAPRPSPPGHPR